MVFKEMYEGIAGNWQPALLYALVLFSIIVGMNNISDANLKEISTSTNTANLMEKGGYFMLWSQSLTSITPAWRFDILGGKYIVGINDIPFPDFTDIIGLLIPILLLAWYLKKKQYSNFKPTNFLIKAVVVIGVMLVVFLAWKQVVYQIYLFASQKLGLSAGNAILIRDGVLNGLEKVTLPMFIIGVFGGLSIYKSVKRK